MLLCVYNFSDVMVLLRATVATLLPVMLLRVYDFSDVMITKSKK